MINNDKNEELIKERGISFEVVSYLIENKEILDLIKHPSSEKYPNQQIFIISYNKYAYLVLFVETKDQIFLKTIIPSRKATRKYMKL